MSFSFSSPGEFLDYVRFARANPLANIQSGPNLEFKRIHEEQRRGREMPRDPHGQIAHDLWRAMCEVLPCDFLEATRNKLVVGVLDNISVNALCLRSPEGFVAVVLNSGLMTFFNKISKLLVASRVPNAIVYCNRGPADTITASVAHEWFKEVCEHYRVTGKPLGPQIHLTPAVASQHAYQLYVWELFVLSHELGHLVAGHLEQENSWVCNHAFGMVDTYIENESHQQETEADILGYVMLRECLYQTQTKQANKGQRQTDDRPILSSVITLFDLFFLLGSRESQTHPDPLDRICNIAAAVYGNPLAKQLASTYGDHKLIAELFSKPIIFNQPSI